MSHFTYLYPYFSSGKGRVIYHKSASEFSHHYFILVSDPDVFKRTGVRIATFSYDKEDRSYEKPAVRYGNTSTGIRLPNRPFEAAIKGAIQYNEGVFESAKNQTSRLVDVQTRLEWLIKRVLDYSKKKKLGSS